MVEEQDDFSVLTGLEECMSNYDSVSEFTDYLNADFASEKFDIGCRGWVFWKAERCGQLEDLETICIRLKIISALKHSASDPIWGPPYLVQFWAPKMDGGHHYLTTSDEPFCVSDPPCKGLCWYRKKCMGHRYYVEGEGANEEQLGAVGRVYRNKQLESTPDLRLYSTNEFPLRDDAARFGIRVNMALPVFDLLSNEFYGVLEVLSFDREPVLKYFLPSLYRALQEANLRSTHTHFFPLTPEMESMPPKYKQQQGSEISKMLEFAVKAVPQLHMAQIWVPCKQCNNLSCLERTTFITAENETLNSCDGIDDDMFWYLQACELHNLQIEKGVARALMSSNSNSCCYRNICDLNISEKPLAHYAQKARLSICFAVCLESVHDSNDIYVVEFFLQSNCRQGSYGDSFLHLLLSIMDKELKNYKFAPGGQLGEELRVELSQPNAIQYESIEYTQEMEHQHSEELNRFVSMEQYRQRYSESNFQKYLQTADSCCLRAPEAGWHGWVFCSPDREEFTENDLTRSSSLVSNSIEEKIKLLMEEIATKRLWDSYSLVQFWAPKMEEDRCYLATSDQPYALRRLYKGLASYRKQCMKHHYFVDEGTAEEELGPPGRVLRNGQPEITPDLRLYSTREFSLRNHAAHCCLRKYAALPLFDLEQPKCIGVLELVGFTNSDLSYIGEALEAANLSSTPINFLPNLEIFESPQPASTEMSEAFDLISEIPQLYMAGVWVPRGKCASINCNQSCMELELATDTRYDPDFPIIPIHVHTRKGIAGMALASENKSCFCRKLCNFDMGEQPLAHYAQQKRLDVCFAICLQSSHTGNLLYVLQFFLYQGPAKCEYLRSFLNFLIPIMKQKLKSFRVASGKQLGEELVVEVIEFSEANKLTFSKSDQPERFPVKFRTIQCGQKEHQYTKDLEVQSFSVCMDSITSGAQTKECSTAADNSKKDDAAKKPGKRMGKTGHNLKLKDLEPHYGKRLEDVAEELGVGRSTIKRVLRDNNISRWPNNKKYKKNPSLFMEESASEIAEDCQQDIRPSSSGNLPPSDMPLHQNVPQASTESTQQFTVQAESEMVIVMVKYEEDNIKFKLHLSLGREKLVEEVARRLNLKKDSFKLKYVDEDNNEILLACDDDLELCPKSLTAKGIPCIHLFLQLFPK